MFSLYSEKYNYIMHTVPKSGCSYLRSLFLEIHSDEHKSASIHNIDNSLFAQKLSISEIKNIPQVLVIRNPYYRLVSGWIDKIVFRQTDEIQKNFIPQFENFLGKPYLNASLEDFCLFLIDLFENKKEVDLHFSTQIPINWRYQPQYVIDLDNLDQELESFYQKLNNAALLEKYSVFSKKKMVTNVSSFNNMGQYILKPFPASFLTVDEVYSLMQIGLMPPREYFFSEGVSDCVRRLYASDFLCDAFKLDVPMYEGVNIKNIQNFIGAFWKKQTPVLLHRGDLPIDFCKICYNELNPNIAMAGIDPIIHFVTSGISEGRKYKKVINNEFFCIHKRVFQ